MAKNNLNKSDKYLDEYTAMGLNPSLFAEKAFGFVPDKYQDAVLFDESRYQLLVWCRQFGKSTVVATKCLHCVVYNERADVLIAAQRMDVAKELILKAKRGLSLLKGQNPWFPSVIGDPKGSLELSNGSRIIAVPGSNEGPRSYSTKMVVVDEASFVPDEFYYAVKPTFAITTGQFIAMSTPFGKRGWFWEAWVDENDRRWKKTLLTAYECERISDEFLESERKILPDLIFRQEYLCEFISTDSSVFDFEDFMGCVVDEKSPLSLSMML